MAIRVQILRGHVHYDDKSIDNEYRKYLRNWESYEEYKSELSIRELIASYNEYYWRRGLMMKEVHKRNNRGFFGKMADEFFATMGYDDQRSYSCSFSRELPHKEIVLDLARKYGKYTFGDQPFVIQL